MTKRTGLMLPLLLLGGAAGVAQAQTAQPYRALGTEPFWSVTIAGGRISYEDSEGKRVSVRAPAPSYPRYMGRTYFAGRMVVRIRRASCSDGMSDRTYEDEVEVVLDGRTLQGCGGAFTEPSRLANTHWRISMINGRRTPAAGAYRLDFTENRLSGQAGCNRLSGSYTLGGDRLTAGPILSTRMACPGLGMTNEQAVLGLLRGTLRVTQPNEHSMILSGRGGSIRLELVPGERPRR